MVPPAVSCHENSSDRQTNPNPYEKMNLLVVRRTFKVGKTMTITQQICTPVPSIALRNPGIRLEERNTNTPESLVPVFNPERMGKLSFSSKARATNSLYVVIHLSYDPRHVDIYIQNDQPHPSVDVQATLADLITTL